MPTKIDQELAGYTLDEAGAVPFNAWLRPSAVTLQQGAICSDDAFYRERVGTVVRHQRGLALKFSQIQSAEDALAFAKRWGLLGLCGEHLEPFSHPGDHRDNGREFVEVALSQNGRATTREPVSEWVSRAGSFRGILGVGASVVTGRKVDQTDVAAALRLPDRALSGECQIAPPNHRWESFVAMEISSLLRMCGVHPGVSWSNRATPKLELTCREPSLLAALAIDLAFTICRQEAVYTCAGCGNVLDRDRKPKAGCRAFCEECQEGKVPQRFAKRDYNARRRAEPKAHGTRSTVGRTKGAR